MVRAVVCVALVIGAACSGVRAGLEPLFDGRTLDGWRVVNGTATFRVEDGTIVGTSVEGTPNTFLRTERTFGDFALELEFKVEAGLNSGVQFRSEQVNGDGRVRGYQCEIDTSDRAWSAGIYDEARRGWLYPLEFNPSAKGLLKTDGWNRLRIECVGTRLRTWLNGAPVSHLVDDVTSEGFIALQVHSIPSGAGLAGKTVRWRNIMIDTAVSGRASADDASVYIRNLVPNQVCAMQAARGWRSLFDGRTTAGWRGAHRASFPSSGWRISDGVLSVLPSGGRESAGGGDIVTEAEFGAFEFEVEFRPSEGANSGIKYCVTEGYLDPGTTASAIGLEYQILDDGRHPDAKLGVVGNRTMASLYDLIPSSRAVIGRTVPRRIGDWNHARIVSRADGRVEHWLNGYLVLEYTRGSNAYRALVARSKYRNWQGFGMSPAGHILLQDHGDLVSFRSVRVRDLGAGLGSGKE